MQPSQKLLTPEAFADGKLKSILIGEPEDVEDVCFLLNSEEPRELCSELQKLVNAWQKSGPNLAKMLRDDGALESRVKHGRTLLAPTRTGKGHLLWLPNPPNFDPSSWKDIALTHFMDLIVNPQWHKLGGPCERCGKYYVKKTARQKKYCSRGCGSKRTATDATRQRREVEHAEKLSRAQEATDRWPRVRTRFSWKEWVSAQTSITVKWLTRAVNSGNLRAPGKKSAQ